MFRVFEGAVRRKKAAHKVQHGFAGRFVRIVLPDGNRLPNLAGRRLCSERREPSFQDFRVSLS